MSVLPPPLFSRSHASHPDLHSFPTRRSSDLISTTEATSAVAKAAARVGASVRSRNGCSTNRHDRYEIATVSANSAILDRKSTRLNSSHGSISYAVFCLKKKI